MLHPVYTLFVCFPPLSVHTRLTKHQLVQDKRCCKDAERQQTEVQISTSGSVTFHLRCCVCLPEVLLTSETLTKASSLFLSGLTFFLVSEESG